jgi:4'-phosphopantetheinyl transferase
VIPDLVEVWWIRADLPDPALAALETLLDATERQRADALVWPVDRGRFVTAHGAARLLIGRRLGVPPAQLSWRYGPHGKPELAGPWTGAQVSLSHSGELAALALTSRRRVGIDLQRLVAGLDVAAMAERFYPPADARFVTTGSGSADQASRFTRLWTRKEACVKVGGGRLIPGLRVPVCAAGPPGTDQPAADQVMAAGPAGQPSAPCLVREVPAPEGFYAAVAAEGPLPYRVTRRWWPGDRPTT